MRIALFGTSADPPHAGHQMVLRWLAHHFDGVAVWASDNPFKSHQTPLEHRAAMLRLLIEDIDVPQHNIHLYPELSHPRAIATVQTAQTYWPEAELVLVIGSDLVAQLPRWHRVDELLQQVTLLIVPRSGYPLNNHDLMELRQRGARVDIADIHGPEISSTTYRHTREDGRLAPPVEAYIQQKHLYECQDTSKKRTPVR